MEETDSTNLLCLRTPEIIERNGLVVTAARQTSGIGRLGRRWEQGSSGNLCCSFVIHPEIKMAYVPAITLFAGLSILKTIRALGAVDTSIKWPNDVLVGGRKVSGILCQSRYTGEKMVVVAGIGVNVAGDCGQFHSSLRNKATTLAEHGIEVDRQGLLEEIARQLEDILVRASKGEIRAILGEWTREAKCIGRAIRFANGKSFSAGVIEAVDDKGRLVVKAPSGRIYKVQSGHMDFDYT